MPKTYIAKALTTLSKRHSHLCEDLARAFTAMSSTRVNALNKSLDLGWLSWQMRNVDLGVISRDQVADKKRAALLLTQVYRLGNEFARFAQGWSEGDFRKVFDAAGEPNTASPRGYYLRGIFWGFSNHSEREWIKHAWNEARGMVDIGIRAVGIAAAQSPNGLNRRILNAISELDTMVTTRRCAVC